MNANSIFLWVDGVAVFCFSFWLYRHLRREPQKLMPSPRHVDISPMIEDEPFALPAGFPPELAAIVLKGGVEFAWPWEFASRVVEWLAQNGLAVVGTDLWMVHDAGIQVGIYVNGVREIHGNDVSRTQNEGWDSYIARSARETLRYLSSFEAPPEANGQGDIFFNVAWASESEVLHLSS